MGRGATDTKTRILAAAANLFSVHGCSATTMEDILTATGITKGAFYYYFKSKETLCLAVLDEATGQYEQLMESLDRIEEPLDRLRTLLIELVNRNASGRWIWCRLMVRLTNESEPGQPKVQKRIRTFWQWFMNILQNRIEECRRAGQIKAVPDVETQTRMLLWLWTGMITAGNIPTAKANPATLPELLIQAIQI
ncbi:MAG: TetR/AcrR family transcriptional regulator [Sedimentisphaerales bacterium]|nr:TetR/AcrR family transcriptional regulator [Sedimentisphaerales bacterium]